MNYCALSLQRMPFTLDNVVPWGRSFDEYVTMFELAPHDLAAKILGCGDGPASFNAGMKQRGYAMVSVDPLYQFAAADIRQRIDATYPQVMAQLEENRGQFLWRTISSPAALGQMRLAAMTEFLADFEAGKKSGRYRVAQLPNLPFEAQTFDVALCSHLLFLYTERLSFDFHRAAILEMCRVAKDVRIFPLIDLAGQVSKHVKPIIAALSEQGYTVSVIPVNYEFQRGGNRMMRIAKSAACVRISMMISSSS